MDNTGKKITRSRKRKDAKFPPQSESDMLAESLRAGFGLTKTGLPDDRQNT